MELKFKSRFQRKAQIDITSLIDLVFLLVAFFMVTSSLGTVSSITVHLPKAVQAGSYKHSDLIVSINEKNEVFINDVKYDTDSLLKEFKKRKQDLKDSTVVIRGDRESSYEVIIKVMDLLNQAGIPNFTLSTIRSSRN